MRISDWSSDVSSSDLLQPPVRRSNAVQLHDSVEDSWSTGPGPCPPHRRRRGSHPAGRPRTGTGDRKSVLSGKSVSVRVDLGGRRIIEKKTYIHVYRASLACD